MVVADEVVTMIGGSLAVLPVRRVGAPESPNLVIGAVTPDGEVTLDHELASRLAIAPGDLDEQVSRAKAMLRSTLSVLGTGEPQVAGHDVIVVSDGAMTGIVLRAAIASLRRAGAARIACAVPVAPPATVDLLADEADEVVCPRQPLRMRTIGDWFELYGAVDDTEVRRLLGRR